MKADFSGYATKAGLKCLDGVTIMPDAFAHQDKMTVPLVYMHGHSDIENILGHAVLTNRPDGVWVDCFFNETPKAVHAKSAVNHKDIRALSIWANNLRKQGQNVVHGIIREVSLVLAGANPGALIDPVSIRHSDGTETILDDDVIIQTGEEFELGNEIEHADNNGDGDDDGATLEDVYDSFTDVQKEVVHFMIGKAVEEAVDPVAHSDQTDQTDQTDSNQEGTNVTHNVFEGKDDVTTGHVLSHDAMKGILVQAQELGSLKAAMQGYALQHGIDDIESLFPEAVAIDGNTPAWITRRMEWVSGFLNDTRKVPFAKIKSHFADLTMEAARAKGYIKGNLKKEQFFATSRRETGPKTVYKKQKLDRDDILDITDFDVVSWIKQEMQFMLREEVARAALIGDGREVDDEDKIDEDKIRPIATDDEFYVETLYVNVGDTNSSYNEIIDAVIQNRYKYKGSGTPNFYTTETHIGKFLTLRETDTGKRMYRTLADVAAELRVAQIIPVEVMEDEPDIVGIIVNPADYTFGATRGGEVTNFEDFDIDYNQQKYLSETRVSGALTLPKSALVIRSVASDAALVSPVAPTFDPETGELTITNTAGVVYKHGVTVVNAGGSPYTVDPGDTWVIDATPASASYYFASSSDDQWTFTADN